ncbi:MAG: 2'-5' RNA ligase family protein [Ahniella sp.]|nr:2'-5' RNA ligase family protein [Ahniella sp.]
MKRIQLSLYVPSSASTQLETIRRLLDPIQSNLIPAHVTLCREDEIEHIEPALLETRLAEATAITLSFGRPEHFGGHGVLLPCVGGAADFHALRKWVLGPDSMKQHAPHITLAHPRNAKAPTNTAGHAAGLPDPLQFTFEHVNRIRQLGTQPWEVLSRYQLSTPNRAAIVPPDRVFRAPERIPRKR